jgi:hypothetical protein
MLSLVWQESYNRGGDLGPIGSFCTPRLYFFGSVSYCILSPDQTITWILLGYLTLRVPGTPVPFPELS